MFINKMRYVWVFVFLYARIRFLSGPFGNRIIWFIYFIVNTTNLKVAITHVMEMHQTQKYINEITCRLLFFLPAMMIYIHILPHSLPFVAMQLEFIWEKLWYICLIVFFKYVRTKSWNTKDYDVNRRTLMKIRKTANALLYSQFFYDNFSKQKKNFEFLWFFSLA